MNRCDICLEENCKGAHNCHCETCSHISECYRVLHATIRITNKCTQKCGHCAFNSCPESNIMMSIEEAKKIGKFLKNNGITYINVMGGEFFCNPDWYEILSILISSVDFMRIVSNGDWAVSDDQKSKLLDLVNNRRDKIRISISNDKWHTNTNVGKAEAWLKTNGILHNIGDDSNMPDTGVVPVGRGDQVSSMYSFFSCYCHNPVHMYSFLIDEEGKVYKCGFGVWNYAKVDDYIDGGFRARFKEFNKKFYDIFVPSCSSCIRVASQEVDNIVQGRRD